MAEEMQNLSSLAVPVDPTVLEPVRPRRGRRKKTEVIESNSVSLEHKPTTPSIPMVPMAPDAPPAVSIAATPVKKKPTRKPRTVKTPTEAAASGSLASDRKSTRLNSSHPTTSRMPSSA